MSSKIFLKKKQVWCVAGFGLSPNVSGPIGDFGSISIVSPVADPGFPRGGGANRKCGGMNLLFWSIYPQKLCENEKNLDQALGHMSLAPTPLDPLMQSVADPGFSRGEATTKKVGVSTYYCR